MQRESVMPPDPHSGTTKRMCPARRGVPGAQRTTLESRTAIQAGCASSLQWIAFHHFGSCLVVASLPCACSRTQSNSPPRLASHAAPGLRAQRRYVRFDCALLNGLGPLLAAAHEHLGLADGRYGVYVDDVQHLELRHTELVEACA